MSGLFALELLVICLRYIRTCSIAPFLLFDSFVPPSTKHYANKTIIHNSLKRCEACEQETLELTSGFCCKNRRWHKPDQKCLNFPHYSYSHEIWMWLSGPENDNYGGQNEIVLRRVATNMIFSHICDGTLYFVCYVEFWTFEHFHWSRSWCLPLLQAQLADPTFQISTVDLPSLMSDSSHQHWSHVFFPRLSSCVFYVVRWVQP